MTAVAAEVKALKDVVRRLSGNASLDMSNPQRGINSGNAPSVQPTVGQKISSLADVSSYNVLDGQVLTWSQQEQKWYPKTLGVAPAPGVVPADTWNIPDHYYNTATNPSFENNLTGWASADTFTSAGYGQAVTTLSRVAGGNNGAYAMQLTGTGKVSGNVYSQFGVALPVPVDTHYAMASMNYGDNAQWQVSFVYNTPNGFSKYDGAHNNTDPLNNWNIRIAEATPPAGTTAMWVVVGGVTYSNLAYTVLVDSVLTTNGTASVYNYFDGSFPAGTLAYSWDGTPGNSTSQAVSAATLFVPSKFPQDSIIEVTGDHYTAGEGIDLYLNGNYKKTVLANSSGAFETTIDVGHVPTTTTGTIQTSAAGHSAQVNNIQITSA